MTSSAPFKAAIGVDYKALEIETSGRHSSAFRPARAGAGDLAALFKKADHLSAYSRSHPLAGFEDAEARRLFGRPPKGLKTPRLTPLATADCPGAVPGTISQAGRKARC